MSRKEQLAVLLGDRQPTVEDVGRRGGLEARPLVKNGRMGIGQCTFDGGGRGSSSVPPNPKRAPKVKRNRKRAKAGKSG